MFVSMKRVLQTAAVLHIAAWAMAAEAKEPLAVWVDVDTSAGIVDTRPRDVDDAVALIQAFHSPELRVAGVSVVFGNSSLENCLPITREIVEKFGPKGMAVHAGAASDADLDKQTDATKALIAALEKEPLHVLALGPVTNVAAVIKQRPDLKSKMLSVLVVAARRPGFDFHPPGRPDLKFPDANFEKDVPGTQILLDSGVPLVWVGYEASCDTWLTRADLDAMRDTPSGKWVADISQAWLGRWETAMKLDGFNPFDALAIVYLTHPETLAAIPVKSHITTGPNDRSPGRLAATKPSKAYLISQPTTQPTNELYVTHTLKNVAPIIAQRVRQRPE